MTQNPGKQDKVLAVVNRKEAWQNNHRHQSSSRPFAQADAARSPKDLNQISDPGNLYQYQDTHYYLLGHVLLIDFDPQGHCARGLGIDTGKADIGDVLLEQRHITEAVVSADRAAEGFPAPTCGFCPRPIIWNMPKTYCVLRHLPCPAPKITVWYAF